MTGVVVSAQSFPGLVLLGIAVLSSLHLFYRDRPQGDDLLHLAMTVIGRVMIITAFVEATFLFLSFLAIPFAIVVYCILVYVALRYVMRRRNALLSVLAAASRRWVPLSPAVAAFSAECGWPFRQRCRFLADLLAAGVPLSDALRIAGKKSFVPRVLTVMLVACFPIALLFVLISKFILFRAEGLAPARAQAMIEVGMRAGNVSGALAVAARPTATQPVMARVWGGVWYLGAVTLIGSLVLTFMAIKIVPAFIKIFDDFDADLPASTRLLIDACDWFATFGWPFLVLGLFSLATFVVLWTFDVIAWLPPPLNALARRRETVVVLRALTIATEVNRPVELALSALAEHYPSETMRGRLRAALVQISQGQPWTEALAAQGVLRPAELAVIASAQRAGNLTWALGDVADSIERRFALRLQRWLEILLPMMVLMAGAIVMFIVVSLFVPLVRLITNLI